MKETTAVLTGFGAVACLLAALPAYMLYQMHEMEMASPQPSNVDGAIARAFLATNVDGSAGQTASVPGVKQILVRGTTKADALHELEGGDFVCSPGQDGTTCLRKVGRGMSREDWIVALGFDAADRVSSASGLIREIASMP